MADVYYTWFGPPALANKVVSGVDGQVRPDVFGITRTAASSFANTPPPRFKFCCLKKYADVFRGGLPDYIDVVPIEDQFDSKTFTAITLSRPSLDDLGLTVDFILRETIAFHERRPLEVKQLAFCKDIWSLYVVWKLGGYHLDCGCFPAKVGSVNIPEPTTFGIAANAGEGGNFPHATIRFAGKTMCSTLVVGSNVFAGLVMAEIGDDVRGQQQPETPRRRVAAQEHGGEQGGAGRARVLRAGSGSRSARRRSATKLKAQAMRELAISAVATGITHSTTASCRASTSYKDHLIDATFSPPLVDSMNIRKVGFASHR